MDDLLDLSFGGPSAASGATQSKSTGRPAWAMPMGGSAYGNGRSAFDLLASGSGGMSRSPSGPSYVVASGSRPASASGTPGANGRLTPAIPSRTATPSGLAGRPGPAAPASSKAAPGATSADAFSSLLDFSGSTTKPGTSSGLGASTSGMSLAEQAAHKQRMAKLRDEEERARFDFAQLGLGEPKRTNTGVQGGGMNPLAASVTPTPIAKPSTSGRSVKLDDFADVWDQPAPTSASTSRQAAPIEAPGAPPPRQTAPRDPWDFNSLDARPASAAQARTGLGNGEDEDPLGMLSKPVDHFAAPRPAAPRATQVDRKVRPAEKFSDSEESLTAGVPRHSFTPQPRSSRNRSPSPSASSRPRSAAGSSARPSSPPPHIIGQLVEMGFGVTDARRALQATPSGVDVAAALEALLAQGRSGSARVTPDIDADEARQRRDEERHRKRRQGPTRERQRTDDTREDALAAGPSSALPAELSEHADRLLSSATVLGRGMLSKASGLWATSKERAMKAYEEGAAARAAGGEPKRNGNADGRPKWMIDAMAQEEDGSASRSPKKEAQAVKWDDSDDDAPQEKPQRRASPPEAAWDDDAILRGGAPSRPRPQERVESGITARAGRTPTPSSSTTSNMSVKEKTAALFSDATPAYRSAGRRAGPSGRGTPQAATPRAATPARPPSPLRTRPHVPVTPTQIARSAQHKAKGNDEFKLGKFAEAAASYTVAIDALPEGQLLRVPLHTNRATAHLKSGGHSEAIMDCTIAIDVIGITYHPAKEAPLAAELAEIKLSDGLVKALNKRATGYEMAEKWDRAKEDWEALSVVLGGPVGADLGAERTMKERAMATEGIARCRKMVDVLAGRSAKPSAPKPQSVRSRGATAPPTRSATPADPNSSAAVSRMREAAQAQESEDAQRLALKDSTDARLLAWSAGKETNLRGLLSSLDGVLGGDEGWKALGIKKLLISDLITDKQVKMGYMKVIGKLHPDKLNVTTTTLEQRMIANGVFGTLNEAWHAFNK